MAAALGAASMGGGGTPTERWIGVSYASHAVACGAEQDGLVVDMPVFEGQHVEQGQVLFRLSAAAEELRARRLRMLADSDVLVRRARAELRFARSEHARAVELAREDVASATELAQRELELTIAEVRLAEAELQHRSRALEAEDAEVRLAQRTVRSPIEGIVARRLHRRGETIEKLDPVVEVIDLDPLWVEFDCPLRDEPSFTPGARVRVRRAASPDEVRVATVVHAAAQADPSSGTFRVRLAVDNAVDPWKAGLKMWIEPPE